MAKTTITEALAEINTLEKRIAKKQEFVNNHLLRQAALKDPLEKQGGSDFVIANERQAIDDLFMRLVDIRSAVTRSNMETLLTIGNFNMSVADWLVWKREVLPRKQQHLRQMSNFIEQVRHEALQKGFMTLAAEADARPGDVVVHIDELKLKEQIEELEEIAGTLDGRLSLLNATTEIDV